MSKILYSKEIVDLSLQNLSDRVQKLKERGVIPSLKVILVGEHAPSLIYTRNKKRFCEKIGAECEIVQVNNQIPEWQFLSLIDDFNSDPSVHGILIQLPVPEHLTHLDLGSLISPHKDVDGFHEQNLKQLMANTLHEGSMVPCTPKGILNLLKHYQIPIEGSRVCIIGRSMIVGKPLQQLLTNHNATVTLCHSRTKQLKELCRNSDIIVTAMGSPRFLTTDYLNSNGDQFIIDVGINKLDDGKLCGDCDFDALLGKVAGITPVPKGIGPLTILSLAQNLLQATEFSL